jgi:hypothetical protein
MPADAANQNPPAPSESPGGVPVAKEAPTEQQQSQPGVPKKITNAQTVCNEKNAKGKLCNGHLKQMKTGGEEAEKHLRGDDVLFQCQTCGTLYMGPPLGHVRDPEKQSRFVEKELMGILRAAGGTLPAFKKSVRGTLVPMEEDASHQAPAAASPAAKPATPAAAATKAATPAAAATSAAPPNETPEERKARLISEAQARKAAGGAAKPAATAAAKPSAPTSGTDSSPEADRHRTAAEAQAATGQASAAPLSSAASTASPAAGAETPSDLALEASTELTPGAPKDERKPGAQADVDSQSGSEANKSSEGGSSS